MIFAVLASAFLGAYAPQFAGSSLPDPKEELHAQQLGKTIRCAVCQGLSIADSPAPMAQAMLDRVRDKVHAGENDQQIRDYFVQRYGEWILLSPPPHGFNWIVWMAPFALIAAGLGLLAVRASRKPEQRADKAAEVPQGGDDYLAAIRREVER